MGLTTILTTFGFVHRNTPKCELLIFKENERLKTSLDTLPMSGGSHEFLFVRCHRDDLGPMIEDLGPRGKARESLS